MTPFWENIFRNKSPWSREVARLWLDTPLFDGVNRKAVLQLVESMLPRRYSSNEPIFHEGDLGAGVVLILSGEVEIHSNGVLLASLTKGDFFGELALVMDERRTADAVSTTDTELVFFLRSELQDWINRAPRQGAQFLTNLSYVLGERLRYANERLSQLDSDQ